MKKILVITPGNTSYRPGELEAMADRIRNTMNNDGFIILSSVRDKYEIIEFDDVVIEKENGWIKNTDKLPNYSGIYYVRHNGLISEAFFNPMTGHWFSNGHIFNKECFEWKYITQKGEIK